MFWLTERVGGRWWAYDPDDGQLLCHDGDEYEHFAYVSSDLDDAGEAVQEYFEDTDEDNTTEEEDDDTEAEETEDETGEEDGKDKTDDEEDDDWDPNRYRLFRTVNTDGVKAGLCLGLSLYWCIERLTTDLSLEDSMPDYSEGRETQEAYEEIKADFQNQLDELLEDEEVDTFVRTFAGPDALEEALESLFEDSGSFIIGFRSISRRVGHAVAVYRDEDELGYFNANDGVFRFSSEEEFGRVLEYQMEATFPDDVQEYKIEIAKVWN